MFRLPCCVAVRVEVEDLDLVSSRMIPALNWIVPIAETRKHVKLASTCVRAMVPARPTTTMGLI
jgi:hypothetical protein